jgi:hypothetical protein
VYESNHFTFLQLCQVYFAGVSASATTTIPTTTDIFASLKSYLHLAGPGGTERSRIFTP